MVVVDNEKSSADLLVVCAEHPTIGNVFWYFVYEGDVNMPDFYGLTVDPSLATRLKPDWCKVNNRITLSFIRHVDFIHPLITELVRNSNLTPGELLQWAISAEWNERVVTGDCLFKGTIWG